MAMVRCLRTLISFSTRAANWGSAAANSAHDAMASTLATGQTLRVAETFDAHYEALLKSLDEMIPLLRSEHEALFAEWFEQDRAKIAGGKTRALQHLLSAYGGAGSINDTVFQERGKQRRFEKLRSEIHKHALAMLSELDESGYYINKRWPKS